ncbi:MAG TPA: anti-sigma factor [Methyloceanibacter sp.]|jgi:anti-sigma-K factor RskA|nr:anti-sigma factor [Methyloceanibacter sp.]
MSDTGKKDSEGMGLTAAEYVLGVLNAAQRRAAERRIDRDPAFAREVAFWEERLGGLAQAVPEIAPPQRLWSRIEARLGRATNAEDERGGLWRSLSFWRGLGLGASALAAASTAALIYVGAVGTRASPLIARLDAEGGQAGFVAAVNTGGGSLTIVPASLLAAEQKAMELWLIPPGDKPHSLGLIDPNRPVTIKVPKDLLTRVNNEAVLAVSLEPPGGSPTGQPTGPVIANGKLAQL